MTVDAGAADSGPDAGVSSPDGGDAGDGGVKLEGGDGGAGNGDAGITQDGGTASGGGGFALTGSMITSRNQTSATLLLSGKVLVAGGYNSNALASSELFDPMYNDGRGGFATSGGLITARWDATATRLTNGKVLFTGGMNQNIGTLSSAEVYDPSGNGGIGSFSDSGSMTEPRYSAVATLLPNGKVLIAGGVGVNGPLLSAEVYDPAGNGGLGSFSITGRMQTTRWGATATLLVSGKVLIAAGNGSGGPRTSAELYDPAGNGGLGSFAPTASMSTARGSAATAILLSNGKVLIVSGDQQNANGELYDPSNGGSFTVVSGTTARVAASAAPLEDGKILITGGYNDSSGPFESAELFDPAAGGGQGGFTNTGNSYVARFSATATLLQGGKVLVACGSTRHSGSNDSIAELYDPRGNGGLGDFFNTSGLASARFNATATLLQSGIVVLAGGEGVDGGSLARVELYDPSGNGGIGSTSDTANMISPRSAATATLLSDGRVLMAGGSAGAGPLLNAELFDPRGDGGFGVFKGTGMMITARLNATATLLPTGKVLIVGGTGIAGPLSSTELYDPGGNGGSGAFTAGGSMATARSGATATLLATGMVLVVGGNGGASTGPTSSAELYDPAGNGGIGTFGATGHLRVGREFATATLLYNGKVLISGGSDGTTLASAELYDPAANNGTATPGGFTATGSMNAARLGAVASLLVDGNVLIAGGTQGVGSLSSAEIYSPDAAGCSGNCTGGFRTVANLGTGRDSASATLLPGFGKVLVVGGATGADHHAIASIELYDPSGK